MDFFRPFERRTPRWSRRVSGVLGVGFAVASMGGLGGTRLAQAAAPGVEALVYSTMPSTAAHRPEMVMDGDPKTYFKSVYGMGDGDDIRVLFSAPIAARSLRITSGDEEGQDLFTDGFVEISGDGVTFTRAAAFDAAGVASAALGGKSVLAVRIRLNANKGVPSLLIREIALPSMTSATVVSSVLLGPGRGFTDLGGATDLAAWADRAEKQMEAFWPDTAALLYSDKFITPNSVNVRYRGGPDVTPVAATGGGVMTVNVKWCREHPEDTGLTVHEMAHVVQSMSTYNPVWLIEGIADYIRWIKFEPENHTPRINVQTASYKDAYRTTATFLAWCELRYDSALTTKMNRAIRSGTYRPELWTRFCGKDADTLWAEFVVDYKADPAGIITAPVAAADRPRVLPIVKAGSSVPVPLAAAFDQVASYLDGATFGATGGLDGGGAAYSAKLLGASLRSQNVVFQVGKAGVPGVVSSQGNIVALPTGRFASLWLLGAAIEGNQMGQTLTVTYTDGTTERLAQNFSDWFQPQRFPGESRALKMPYRNLANGVRDPRTFYAYSYGFPLNPAKTVKSLTLPGNANVKVLAVTLAN
ncbi:MAG: hypothetical protein H7Z41_12585 [Cytophagales bacterium]|nr:hypothetical protein [Armatimonadota bacterium]